MGYYQIRTSEIQMDDREVIDQYHGLSRSENQFEELKGPWKVLPMKAGSFWFADLDEPDLGKI